MKINNLGGVYFAKKHHKNTDLDKKVSDTKVSVNQKQVIESQKEAVEDSKSIEKIFKDKDEPQRVQFRDYSGKIKYDQLNSNNIKDDISCSDNIKLDNNKNSPQKEKIPLKIEF